MQNPNDVTTQAFDGYVGEIAIELGITDKRVYELLGRDNHYPKLWRLLNPLGRIAADRLELVRAGFNARCDRILLAGATASTPATVHEQISQAMQKILDNAPPAERRKEIVEAIAELAKELNKCGGETNPNA